MAKQRPTIYLLDASSYIHRAFHAIRGLSTADGTPTGAVFGFLQMLIKVMKEAQPSHLAVVYDAKGPTFRHERYPAYKANRPPLDPALKAQMPIVRQVVTALGLPAVEMEGFEADDLMATLAAQAADDGFEVVLVSADKDLYQLVGEHVTMWDTMKDVRYTPAMVEEKLGLPPEKAVDLQALTGDSTDNIPGVSGVGPKTALKLLLEHGDLESVLDAAEGMKKSKLKENLIAERDMALLSRELVRLASDAPLQFDPEAFQVTEPDPAVITPILAQLEFTSLMSEFAAPAAALEGHYTMVVEAGELEAFLRRARKKGLVAVDTETTSIEPMRADLVGFSLSFEPGRAIYVPVGHNLRLGEKQADREAVLGVLKEYMADPELKKVGQNIKYDLIVLRGAGVEIQGITADTMVASYLINPGKNSHGLTAIAGEYLGRSMISYQEATGGKNKSFADTDLESATEYAAEDADVTLQAWAKLEPLLGESGAVELFNDLEMPLVPVLARMEMNGVGLDSQGLKVLSQELGGRLEEIEETCYRLAGHSFNLNSPAQLGKVLFEELGLTQVKKTKKKTAYSTDMSVLTILAEEHELPAAVLEYRSLAKLRSTYIETLPQLINPATGRIHTSFNQAVTATGRLSSSDPNLQNIPVRSELGSRIRRCFVPGPGMIMLSADYSQIELRVLAHLSQDELLLSDLAAGADVHTLTAARLFDVDPGEVTPDMRRRAKTVNFGVLYGMSAFRLAREQKIERAEAQEIIDKYLGRYKGIARFQEENLAAARELGYVSTLLGRRRYLPAINSSDRVARDAAARVALNTPIQGTAADIIKLAMLQVDGLIAHEFPRALMILQVHDELVFEVPDEEVDTFAARVKETMEHAVALDVSLDVDLGWGANWAEAH